MTKLAIALRARDIAKRRRVAHPDYRRDFRDLARRKIAELELDAAAMPARDYSRAREMLYLWLERLA